MLQGVMMMFSNPMLAGADGGKMEKIAGEKTIVNYKEQQKKRKDQPGYCQSFPGQGFLIVINVSISEALSARMSPYSPLNDGFTVRC